MYYYSSIFYIGKLWFFKILNDLFFKLKDFLILVFKGYIFLSIF